MDESRTGRGWLLWVGCLAFALMLLVSALLKAFGPNAAATGLGWTGLAFETRLLVVAVSVVVEACLGAGLLLWSRSRLVLRIGLVLGIGLLVLHSLGLILGRGHCGCFGEWVVPDPVTLAGLAVGSLSCALLARGGGGLRPPITGVAWRLPVTLLLIGGAAFPLLDRPDLVPVDRLLDHAALAGDVDEALFVIGAFECPPCYEGLERIAEMRKTSSRLQSIQIHFVTPLGSQFSPESAKEFPWLHFLRIPEGLWRTLVKRGTPAFVHYRRGEPLVVEGDWSIPPDGAESR